MFSACSATCGPGTQTRTRNCDNPPQAYGGKECSTDIDDSSDSENCNIKACPSKLNELRSLVFKTILTSIKFVPAFTVPDCG